MKPILYRYRASDAGVCGWYQADCADVKAFYRAARRTNNEFNLYWLVVNMGDFYWVWSASINRWYRRAQCPWWAK